MADRVRGLYELLITAGIEDQLKQLGEDLEALKIPLRRAEAADRFALHLSEVVRRAIESVSEADRLKAGVALTRRLIAEVNSALGDPVDGEEPVEPASVLT